MPFSLLARLSLAGWRALAKPELRFASERAVRLPAFAFGVAAIGALAWCLWRIGLPWAAGFAAIFLSIHPWHLRYTSEARDYSLLLLCVPLTLGANLLIFLWHYEWRHDVIKWNLIRDVLSHLWVGTAFSFRHAPEHYAELADVARAAPVFFLAAAAATGALCLLGAVRLATRAKAGTSLLAVLLLPAPLMILGAYLRETLTRSTSAPPAPGSPAGGTRSWRRW